MAKELIIDIEKITQLVSVQVYLGQDEFACKNCGSLTPWPDVRLYRQQVKGGKTHYRAFCDECKLYSHALRQSKIERIYWKGDYTDVGEFDTGLLKWMIDKGYIKNKQVKEYAIEVVNQRQSLEGGRPVNVKDIRISHKEQEWMDNIRELKIQLKGAICDTSAAINEACLVSKTAPYSEVQRLLNRVKAQRKKRVKLEKDLKELENEIEKLRTNMSDNPTQI